MRLRRAGLVTLHSGDPGLRLGDTTVPPAESRLIRTAKAVLESAARAEKSRGGAPKGAPAGVIGRLISGLAGDRPDREAGHGVPRPAPVGSAPLSLRREA